MGTPVAGRHDEGGGCTENDHNAQNDTSRCGRFCAHMKTYPASLKAFFVELIDGYGGKFVAMLAIVYFCVKGFANNATSYVMLPFYKKSLKVPAAEYQKYFNVANMAFSLKPLVGVISDLAPIFGFHKRFYVVIMALLGAGCLFCVTILPASDTASSGPASAGLLFVFFSGVAGMDLLMEGKYSEIMNLKLAPPSVVSFVWLAFSAGSLLGTGIEGPLADYASPELVMWISVPFFATAAVPALLGWLPEKRIKGGCCGSDACSFLCCCFSGRSVHSADCEEGNNKRDGGSITAPLRGENAPPPTTEKEEINENGEVVTKRYGSDENVSAEVATRRAEEEAAREAIESERIASRIRNAQPALSLARLCPCLFGNKKRLQAGGYSDMDGALVASSSEIANNPELLDSATQHKGVAMLGIMTAMCSLTMALITLLATQTALITFIIPAVVVLVGLSLFILPKAAAMANLYMFARELSYLQITGFLDYFFTSDQQCLPGGPDFSFTYYQTTVNVLSSVGTFLGAIVFQKFLSGMTFRRVFWLSNTLKIVASLFDLILTKRWNIDIGINDHVVFLCGDAIIYPICTMLDFMPASVLLSRLCPPGMECTMFALLASFSNFGQSISRSFGYMLAEKVGIRTEVSDEHPHCDFDKLWLLVVVGHIAMPTANYVLAYFLIPDTPMTRNVAGAGVEDIASDDGEAGAALIRNEEETENDASPSARKSVRASTSLTAALLRRSGAGAPHRQHNHRKLEGDDDLYINEHVIGTDQSGANNNKKRASVRQSQATSGHRNGNDVDEDEEDPYRHEGGDEGHRQRE